MSKPSIHVAIALIFYHGKVLVGWRTADQHQGNKYEFPGGKVEVSESPEQACRREVFEEVGIGIQQWHTFDVIQHDYDDIQVNLHLFHAYATTESLSSIQKPWTWYSREKLQHLDFPKANQAIIQRLMWQHYIKISHDLDQLKYLSEDTLLYWRTEIAEFNSVEFEQYSDDQLNHLILNIEHWKLLSTVQQQHISAVHIKQNQLMSFKKGQLPVGIRCIAACHDAVSVQHAQQLGVDAILLSPVQSTETHPNTAALGWESFQELAETCDIPVFALGGLKPENLEMAQQHHAYGIAGIRSF